MSHRLWHAVLAASVALAPVAVSAETAASAGPSAAVISMREQWLNPAVNSFTFRDTDKVFESRAVPRKGPVWPLLRGPQMAMPAHQSGGQTMAYDAWADRTFTNAFMVMKDGQFIYVHPATRTVIVKLSYNPPVEPEWLTGEVIDYFHAIARAPTPK